MESQMIRYPSRNLLLAFIVALGALAGCARVPVAPAPQVALTRILVIPVMPIDRLYTQNLGIPVGVLWQSIADRVKSNDFTERMDSARNGMGPRMTAALVKQLNAQGYEAQVMEAVERPPSSPDDIDYQRLPGTDPVLHVYFTDVGMHSSRFSLNYIPRVNVTAHLVRPKADDYVYSETVYYGADSRGDASWSIPADERHKWPSFDALIQQPQVVAESYEAAVDALAKKIAANIQEQAGPAPGQLSKAY
jgi:hypothetical protein